MSATLITRSGCVHVVVEHWLRDRRASPSNSAVSVMPLASLGSQLTTWIAANGLVAVFLLMALDAVLPIGGELIMLYAGVIAAGVVSGAHPSLLGLTLSHGAGAYVGLSIAGSLGSLAGSLIAWTLGKRGGRTLLERHGRWLHVTPARLARAEALFARYGIMTLLIGRLTPVVRSFISIPAGVLDTPLVPFASLTLLASAIWAFGFAGVGWALGGSWHSFDSSFRDVEYALVAIVVLAIVGFALRSPDSGAARRSARRAGLTPVLGAGRELRVEGRHLRGR